MARRAGLPPVRKSLGQHFLTDQRILTRIVDALAPAAGETVVEIGPGRGALTDILRERAHRLVAIELDRALAERLTARYDGDDRVRIVQADVLSVDLAREAGGPYALIGNVPYNITTPILFHALKPPRPKRAVFLVQREVADRMRAAPGGKEYGALTVNLQALASVRTLFDVPAGAFHPKPKVSSAVVEVVPRDLPQIQLNAEQPFREFVQMVFGMRRKQMKRLLRAIIPASRLAAEDVLQGLGIEPEARPETLPIDRFVALFEAIRKDL